MKHWFQAFAFKWVNSYRYAPVDPALALVKGGGGALLREKMVEQAAAAGPSRGDRGSWGSQAGFANLKTQRRAEQRADAAAGKRAVAVEARRAHFREDGEHSDGQQSTTSGVSEAARALARSELDADLR